MTSIGRRALNRIQSQGANRDASDTLLDRLNECADRLMPTWAEESSRYWYDHGGAEQRRIAVLLREAAQEIEVIRKVAERRGRNVESLAQDVVRWAERCKSAETDRDGWMGEAEREHDFHVSAHNDLVELIRNLRRDSK